MRPGRQIHPAAGNGMLGLLLLLPLFAAPASGRSHTAPDSKISFFSEPGFQGEQWSIDLGQKQKGRCCE